MIRRAIGNLNDEDFEVREKAERELLSQGDVAAPAIQAAVSNIGLPEVILRGNRILDVILRSVPPRGEPLRRWRAIQVLERIGSKEAREVLEMLEKESPSLRERREAKAALDRLSRGAGFHPRPGE